jgi:hypothetical protein
MVPDAPQMNVWSGLAEVSPAPPLTPATVVDVGVAAGEVAAGAVAAVGDAAAVGTAVAGVVTEVDVLPHPAAARAAAPNTHDAMRRRVRPTKSPPSLRITGPFGRHNAANSHPPLRSPHRGGQPPTPKQQAPRLAFAFLDAHGADRAGRLAAGEGEPPPGAGRPCGRGERRLTRFMVLACRMRCGRKMEFQRVGQLATHPHDPNLPAP